MTRSRAMLRPIFWLLVAALTVTGLSVVGGPAYAADDGHITGAVTGAVAGADDVALEGIQVIAFRDDSDGWVDVGYATSDDQGRYDMAGLPAGTYRLQFDDDDDSEVGYIREFYNNADSVETADDIEVETGDTVDGINAQLTTYGQIAGTVTGTVEGGDDVELGDVGITVFRNDGDGWVDVKYATTDDQGRYAMAGLTAGTYRLQFEDYSDAGYLTEFYNNADNVETADDIKVETGDTVDDINAQLTTGGHITGAVTGAVAGADDVALEGIQVIAFRDDSDGWVDVGYATSDDQGRYDMAGLPAGTYRLQFDDDDDSEVGYIREFYNNADSVETADDIEVETGDTVDGINAQLTTYGQIAGTVTGTVEGGDDVELGDVGITVFRNDGDGWVDVKYATTDDQGRYAMAGLTAGTYRLQFEDYSDAGYLTEFYNNADNVETADDIKVETGDTVDDINAQLTTGGHITGAVTGAVAGADDVALEGIQVIAFRDDSDGWVDVGYATSDDQGRYDMAGLPAGTYRLQFDDDDDSEVGYIREFYNNADSVETADDIEVETGDTVDGINAQLTTYGQIAGTVTGTVEGGDDVELGDVGITVFRNDGDGWVDVKYATTDDQGRYAMAGLTAGTYRLQFEDYSDAGYLTEFYNNADSVETADDIKVETGDTVDDINAQLTTGGHITGAVTGAVAGADDVALEGIQVIAFRDDSDGWVDVGYATSDDQGRYDMAGLPAGTYRLQFDDDDDSEVGYIREFYNNADSVETADDIEVETGDTVDGINAQLTTYGQIAGTVTGTVEGGDDVELGDVGITVFRNDGDGWVDVKYATTDDQGRYAMAGLTAGTYRLQFEDYSDAGYLTEFYNNADSVETADDIKVETGDTVDDINAQLTTPSHITGSITGDDDVQLEDVSVSAFRDDDDGWVEIGYTSTDGDGDYDLAGLPAGTYRLEFYDTSDAGYLTEFYNNATSVETADDIAVETGDTVDDINAQLTTGGHITGSITGDDDVQLEDVSVSAFRDDDDGWVEIGYTSTDGDGDYDLAGLPAGTYRLEFYDTSDAGYLTEFYNNATSVETADDIAVETGDTVDDINAQLTTGGHITGAVTGAVAGDDDVTLEDVSVSAFRDDSDGWVEIGYTSTDGDGDYDLAGLPAGTYRLEFYDTSDAGYLTEFYDNADSVETATDVEVTTGATVAGKDARLTTPAVANTAVPTITGTARVGSTLTASTGSWDPADGLSFSYRWLVGGDPVSGAGSATYVPTAGDVGKTVKVEVTASASGFTPGTATSAATAAVTAAQLTTPAVSNTAVPTITGTARVGSTLTASTGSWDPADGLSFAYRWLVAGKPVAGAKSATYVPTPHDLAKTIQVEVTASATGHGPGTASSRLASVGKGTLKTIKKPKVTGKVKNRATLKVSAGRWSPANVKVRYTWFAGRHAIPKAKGKKLKLVGKTAKTVTGKTITVLARVSAPGYATVTMKVKVRGKLKRP